MKSREEVARKVEELMTNLSDELYILKDNKHHFGWQELKVLMDFIFGGPPKRKCDELRTSRKRNNQ